MFVIHVTLTIFVGQLSEMIEPKVAIALLIVISEIPKNAVNLMPELVAD